MLSKSVLRLDCIMHSLFALYFGSLVLRSLSLELYRRSTWGLIWNRSFKDTKILENRLKGSRIWPNSVGTIDIFRWKREHKPLLFCPLRWSKKSRNFEHIHFGRHRSIPQQLRHPMHSRSIGPFQPHDSSVRRGHNSLPKWRPEHRERKYFETKYFSLLSGT